MVTLADNTRLKCKSCRQELKARAWKCTCDVAWRQCTVHGPKALVSQLEKQYWTDHFEPAVSFVQKAPPTARTQGVRRLKLKRPPRAWPPEGCVRPSRGRRAFVRLLVWPGWRVRIWKLPAKLFETDLDGCGRWVWLILSPTGGGAGKEEWRPLRRDGTVVPSSSGWTAGTIGSRTPAVS